ncbi:MAG: extracellular solute-binding protein [Clostridia bacterium]|nr:extracellular solute-binding protein [Clostridia bacterium]
MLKRLNKLPSYLYIALCFAFFYLPIIVTIIFSFNESKSLTHFTGFSLRWYGELIKNQDVMSAVYVSLSIAIIATAISTVLGTLTAIGLSNCRKILREWTLTVNDIPIMNPEIVTAIGLMLLFSSLKMEKGYLTMLLAHICFCTPYVITSVYPKVRELDKNIANAAMDLGATPYQALTKVIIPILKPGIFAGILLAFTMSIDDFVISYFVSGNGVMNISIIVYNMTKRVNPTINALSTLLILVIVIILLIVNLLPLINKKKSKVFNRILAGGFCLIFFFTAFSYFHSSTTKVLKVYNAGEYIDTELITKFEEEYNCSVVYETFDSNESMYTKLLSGEEYDIIIPSDYMIERLIKEDFLQEIDWSLIPNKDNLIPEIMDKSFDPGNKYTVPYFWGNVGILYDTTVVEEADLTGWEILRNPEYNGKIYMYDSERDSMMVALKALGYSMNTTNRNEIYQAYEWLLKQKELVDPIYVGDEVIDNMISGNKAMAVVYSGDASYIITENPNLDYFAPHEGTNMWYDAMVLTKFCEDTDLAHKFMNFMLDEENALLNTDTVGYAGYTTNDFEEMKNTTYQGVSAYEPRTGNEKDEIFGYQDSETKKYFSELWTKVKSH